MGEERVETDGLTPIGRVLLGMLWFGATLWAAAACISIAILESATFFGEPPTDEMRREGLAFSLAGALIAFSGPLGVWFFHRRRGWLYLAVALGSLGVGFGIYALFGSP